MEDRVCTSSPCSQLACCCYWPRSAAWGQDARYNFDKNADFSIFKTYKWVALKDAAKVDDLTEKQIKEALDAELAQKGLSKVDGDQADLFIGYQAAIGTEKQFTSFNTDWGYGPGWYRGGWYGYPGETSLVDFDFAKEQLLLKVRKSRCSVEGIQIAGKQSSIFRRSRIRRASRRSCFCFRVSAARIFAGSPTRHSIPNLSSSFKNHCIAPVASMPTITGPSKLV